MAYSPDSRTYAPGATANAAVLDAGLRSYMLNVYNWMASGLLLTGVVSYAVANTSLINLFYPAGADAVRLAPHAGAARHHRDAGAAGLRAGAQLRREPAVEDGGAGDLLGVLRRDGRQPDVDLPRLYRDSIVRTFFVTAGTFGAMSLFGYTTKRDLSHLGSFLIMGLFGVIIASLVNMFIHSSGMQFIISIVGVLVFVGLTAYDTQRIKLTYTQYAYAEGPEQAGKRSVYDALSLYLNFINLFMLLLLQLTGSRRQ